MMKDIEVGQKIEEGNKKDLVRHPCDTFKTQSHKNKNTADGIVVAPVRHKE